MQNKILTEHFSLLEFTESPTAKKHGIKNEPPPEAIANLKTLCLHTMEPLRTELGLPVIITSGYRSEALNNVVSHYATRRSQHLAGRACDFYVGWNSSPDGRGLSDSKSLSHRERLIRAFRLIIESDSIDYDQLIIYPSFIHVSYVSPTTNRHYIMTANGQGKYCRVIRDVALTLS